MRILVFGDSITQGYWDAEAGGWVQRLRRHYDQQALQNLAGDYATVFNLGISGDTTAGLVKRMPYEIEARRYPDEEFVIVISIGMNDAVTRNGEAVLTLEEYREGLEMLYGTASQYSERILFVGMNPVDDKLCNPWIYSTSGKSWSNQRILQLEGEMRKFCIEKNCPQVQVFETFQAENEKQSLLADGLHPNGYGHELIAGLVKPELDKVLLS